jgi:hypothetical protein
MSSETDLSTDDLAQPGGSRRRDIEDDEQRGATGRAEGADRSGADAGERTYATSGNRVADDQDTVLIAPGDVAGSTREDARTEEPYPGRPGADDAQQGMGQQGMGQQGTGQQGMADRDMGQQGWAERDTSQQGMAEHGMAQQDMAEQDMGDRDMGDQGIGQQRMADRGMGDRGMGQQGMGQQQGMADRDAGGRGAGAGDTGGDVALLDPADAQGFQQRWSDAQARFVDDPREAVQTADGLVAELMQTLAQSFSQHKGQLEAQWQSGGDPDTEELRQALQRYRSFFDRLLSA